MIFFWRVVFRVIVFLGLFLVSAFCQLQDPALARPGQGGTAGQSQSLGDVARKLRKDTTNEVKMTDADTKKLFESVDKIFAFAAEDTEMPKRAVVKRRLVSKEDVEKF